MLQKPHFKEEQTIIDKYIDSPELPLSDMTTELVFLRRPDHKAIIIDYTSRGTRAHKAYMTEEELHKYLPEHSGSDFYRIPTKNIWYEDRKEQVKQARKNNKKYIQLRKEFEANEDLE